MVFVGIFEVSRLMMLFGSFREIRIVRSDPPPETSGCGARIALGKTLILRLIEPNLFDRGAFSVATLRE